MHFSVDAVQDRQLRAKLEQITFEQAPAQHIALIAAIGGHTIVPLSDHDVLRPRHREYNCFAFALNLADSAPFRMIASRIEHLHADEQFAQYLIERGNLTIVPQQLRRTLDHVLYFDGTKPTHAGKVRGDRVISKWGTGLLWEHEFFEVPASYGDSVEFFKDISAAETESLFVSYAAEHGMRVEDLPEWHDWKAGLAWE